MSDPQPPFGYPRGDRPPHPHAAVPASAQQNPYLPGPGAPGGHGAPGSPGSPYAFPFAPPPAPPRRGLSAGGIIAIVLGSAALILVAGCVVLALVLGSLFAAPRGGSPVAGSSPTAQPTSPPQWPGPGSNSGSGRYSIVDRPAYATYALRVRDMQLKYQTALKDGSIHQWVVDSPTGDTYAQAFVYFLTDKKVALLWISDSSDDPAELDATVAEWDAELTELERTFLAGEPFGADVTIKRSDGTTFHYDGAAGPNG